ncbi:MAG: NAD(P)H-hydrate epimerase [Planctomycetota bacterium]|nr:NAD(P)H-hydrate epimerase [Planctomycetota bacterium]
MNETTNSDTLYFSRKGLQAIDQDSIKSFGVPSIVLMENAARGAARKIHSWFGDSISSITVVCGSGNNGGDGYGVARHLSNLGYKIHIFQLAKPRSNDSQANERIVKNMNIPIENWSSRSINEVPLVIDAIFGTGLNRAVVGKYADAIKEINELDTQCVSLDIPSGLDCDNGTPHGCCVKADNTITFVGLKLGFIAKESRKFTGNISVIDIGCPHCLLPAYGVGAT